MDSKNNERLRHFAKLWRLNGDLMMCRACGRSLIASRDGEALQHRAGCPNETHVDPWVDLRTAMQPA